MAVHFFTELVHQRPRTWKADLETLYQLLGEFGEAALLEALLRGLIGAEYIVDLATRQVSA